MKSVRVTRFFVGTTLAAMAELDHFRDFRERELYLPEESFARDFPYLMIRSINTGAE